jgi:hypothetical protein
MAPVEPRTASWFTYFPEDYQHCQRDYLSHGTSVIFDWLAEKL